MRSTAAARARIERGVSKADGKYHALIQGARAAGFRRFTPVNILCPECGQGRMSKIHRAHTRARAAGR